MTATPPPELREPARVQALIDLIETVFRLRAPGGCPWDRAQTHQSLRQYLIEEAYEVLDVLDRIDSTASLQDPAVRENFREELGDLLMQVVLHAEMTRELGVFDIFDVARGLNDKLIRRHPHVFGEQQKAGNADQALQNWEKEKAKEKAALSATASVLDGLPRNLPALQKTARMIEKVTKVGFQWPDATGPLEKMDEELGELRVEVRALEAARAASRPEAEIDALRAKTEKEVGDLLFSVCNVAYLMKVNPEDALRNMLQRFERRFRYVETGLREKGRTPAESNQVEMDVLWNEAKARE